MKLNFRQELLMALLSYILVIGFIVLFVVGCGRTTTYEDKRTFKATCEVPKPQIIEKEIVVRDEIIKEITKEKPIITTKVEIKKIPVPLLYYTQQCGRNIWTLQKTYYVINNNTLVLLTDQWYKISNSCKLRIKKNKLQVGN